MGQLVVMVCYWNHLFQFMWMVYTINVVIFDIVVVFLAIFFGSVKPSIQSWRIFLTVLSVSWAEVKSTIDSLPIQTHPMTQLSVAMLALQKDSKFFKSRAVSRTGGRQVARGRGLPLDQWV